ncbi:DUF3618 domain-containing protein [Dactylosporangium sp. NPDC051541]|uniref:DUF3618 domain-containing protein n=1 Tax=Dactylosporangium sp. NPDC051541 TaxID=3363977 RepID=UPI0037BA285B
MSTAPNPDELRSDIAATRAELGDTVEQLAAKTDVKARAASAAAEAVDSAKQKARDAAAVVADKASGAAAVVADKASGAAGVVADKAGSAASSLRATVRDTDFAAEARRPLPWAVIAGAVAGIVVIVYAVRRRRG